MKQKLKLTRQGRARLREIREEIERLGRAGYCPAWTVHSPLLYPAAAHLASEYKHYVRPNCAICAYIFPRVRITWHCPCYAGYSRRHLLRVIDRVLAGEMEVG